MPAWRATRGNVVADIQSGESHGATGRLWMRHAFVVGQVAASVTLLVISALLIRSLIRVTSLDPGFDLDRGLVAAVNVEADRYAVDGGLPLGERIVDALEGMPGVESSSFAGIIALGMEQSATRLQVEGVAPGQSARAPSSTASAPRISRRWAFVSSPAANSIRAIASARRRSRLSARRSRGRTSLATPRSASGSGAPRMSPTPRSSASSPTASTDRSAKRRRRCTTRRTPNARESRRRSGRWSFTFARRDRPPRWSATCAALISAIEPAAFVDVRTLRDATSAEAGLRRLGLRLFAILGIVALLLATMGLYGVMAFVVSSRTREIGTRVALGAASGDILRGVLVQGLRLVAAGLAIGALVSWLIARLLVAGLAGLSPADPIAYASTAAILLVVGLAACYFPARRAASLSPMVALRDE